MIRFESPWFLLLLLILPLMISYLFRSKKGQKRIQYSHLGNFADLPQPFTVTIRKYLPTLRVISATVIIVALARPQITNQIRYVEAEALDIMLVLDSSGSMKAEDFEPDNRLEVAKEVVKEFIAGREFDRIGLVVFAGQTYTKCPLTIDHEILNQFVDDVRFDVMEDGTAVGLALSAAINRLKDSSAKSKVVVLLTDGRNNRGEISPRVAAQMARALGIKV